MSMNTPSGRLSTLSAALVIARRDFGAILFSRSFFFFLLGPLFPFVIAMAAGNVGQKVEQAAAKPVLGLAMSAEDNRAMLATGKAMQARLDPIGPDMALVRDVPQGEAIDAQQAIRDARGNLAAVLTGSLAKPVLSGTSAQIEAWKGPVALIAARAHDGAATAFPEVALTAIKTSAASTRQNHMRTAQAGQTVLFLLTMLLAGMVLSNLVEEKANKIIEVLAAAIPMDAVFFGKLFAMLGVSFVGIAVWGGAIGLKVLAGGTVPAGLAEPAIGWPLFVALGIAYFAMAYLLLGSVFLTIGSMASTVREVQTLSMPASMGQLMVFFFASYAVAQPGTTLALVAEVMPISSPFAMLAHGAQYPEVWPHLAALGWQALWVALFVRYGAQLFRRRAMKSGPQGTPRGMVRSNRGAPQPA